MSAVLPYPETRIELPAGMVVSPGHLSRTSPIMSQQPRLPQNPPETQKEKDQREPYPSDLTDAQYQVIEALLRSPSTGARTGRPPRYTHRQIMDGILYAMHTGCAWRYLPHDLPHWTSVYAYWKRWSADGTLEQVQKALRRQGYSISNLAPGSGRPRPRSAAKTTEDER